MNCDLHTHSIYSDGSWNPTEIIAEAKRLELGAVALTDHNTVAGLPEFMAEAERLAVTAVPGVELTCEYDGSELHLVGLFIPSVYYAAVEHLAGEQLARKELSNRDLIDRLNGAGYAIDYSAVKNRTLNGNANRAHVAAELVERGYVGSVKEAFDTLLDEGMGFYVRPEALRLTDAVRFLREIKAVPVLAHPLKDLSEEQLRKLLPNAVDAGLIAMETMHSAYDESTAALAAKIADEFGLLPSGGSDFHGAAKPDVFLGRGKGQVCVGMEIYEALLEKQGEI